MADVRERAMDTKQRTRVMDPAETPAAAAAAPEAAAPAAAPAAPAAVPSDNLETEIMPGRIPFPAPLEVPASSNLRKEQVRAALFRKLEPVKVGRFILLEPLGAGAMGEIYAAYDDQLDRKVALKLV